MMKKERVNSGLSDKIFMMVVYTVIILLLVIFLYPILYVISASVSDPNAVVGGEMILFPVGFTLDGYQYLLQYKEIWTGYANTIFYTVAGTLLNLAVTLPCAYAMARKDLKGRRVLMIFFMITMYFNAGLIPGYLNVRSFGLLDTRTIILINGLMSTYNMIVARTYFMTSIPYEIQEAAIIDGCNDFQIFGRIVLPISKAISVVMMLYYGVGHWNSYFESMVYLDDRTKYPLQLFLREILTKSQFAQTAMMDGSGYSAEEMMALIKQTETANMIKYGVIVVSMVPMLAIYPFLQKYFEKGVMIGSVKG